MVEQLSLFPAPEIVSEWDEQGRIILAQADAYQFIAGLPDDFVKLIITSPPYNLGKEYESRVGLRDYLATQKEIIGELVRVLHPEGSICWQVGNFVRDGEIFPLDIYYYDIFKDFGLQLRNRIIWHFGHGLHAKKRFSGRYETILWFSKTKDYTFNLDPVRVPSKYPGKRHFKGPKKGQISGNPLGKNPSDMWEFIAQEWDLELWDIPNVKSNHPEKTEHPCQYPVELVERCLLALTDENDWILDPFAGVGSSLIAGLKHNRKVMGCDKEEAYIQTAKERIHAFYRGQLKLRPLGKTVYKPTGKEKVAQIPDEWKDEAE
jgi:adenine-specific DNA-methyltransferase